MPLESSTKSLAMFGGKPSQRAASTQRRCPWANTSTSRPFQEVVAPQRAEERVGPLADVGGRFA